MVESSFSLAEFSPALIIFDKDGTLIDFNFMWASWVTELSHRLVRSTNCALANMLYRAIGYDEANARVIAGSPLAAHSMANLRELTIRVAQDAGLSRQAAEQAVAEAWFIPDPVAMARPVADLPRVFSTLRARNILTAIATSDDRAPTEITLKALGIAPYVNALVSADDDLPNKPAPDMLLHICRLLDVEPSHTAMVGDSVADMQAAEAAGIPFRIGVLSGVTSRELLAPYVQVVLSDIGSLVG
ncbi:MAG TPA: HAD family hydrolase [Anaerolineae bacterium]|nr:HAD family hydrolase [Anaerolineae bacterium]